jgi:Fe-S-cluster containining protein
VHALLESSEPGVKRPPGDAMSKARREVITAKTCLSCGACCVAPQHQDTFADIYVEDLVRLGPAFTKKHVAMTTTFERAISAIGGTREPPDAAIRTRWRLQKKGPLRSYELLTCAALRGDVFKTVSCSVYQKRPRVYREAVKPGDRTCRAIRAAFQDRIQDSPAR